MKLKTRLTITAIIMVVAPLLLTCVSFIALSIYRFKSLYDKVGPRPGATYEIPTNMLQTFIMQLLFAITIILVITSLFITSETYKSVAKPVWKLNEAMRQIAKGNLDCSIQTEGSDEFSELCNNFDVMRRALKETMETKVKYDQDNRELISNISHDLKTPITSIKGYCEGLIDGVADTPEKMDKYIRTIYNKAIESRRNPRRL